MFISIVGKDTYLAIQYFQKSEIFRVEKATINREKMLKERNYGCQEFRMANVPFCINNVLFALEKFVTEIYIKIACFFYKNSFFHNF